jgi:antitoxin (DNA-binding transcriptional repressor) of toxin-antitoxin stability system
LTREINQRELRNHSGEIMRQLDQDESFIVTRNGSPPASFPRCVGIDL